MIRTSQTCNTPRATLQHKRSYATSISAGSYSFGQPVHETHPHLLDPGELTPGITAQEYADRRTTLASKLPKNAIAILSAADTVFRSGNVFYPFYQDPDFYYLTGFNEPEALCVVGKDVTERDHVFHLYVREKDSKAEMWDGARSGTDAARDVWNADETGDIANIKTLLPDIVGEATVVYTDILKEDVHQSTLSRFLNGAQRKKQGEIAEIIPASKVRSLRPLMNDLRIFKSPAEVECMGLAGRASGLAHTDAMRSTFTTERDLHAYLSYRQISYGCDSSAFEPVVAGGQNALSIHYVRNDDVLQPEDMVLVDGGGKYGGYVADITRTFPVDGRFSDAQRDLYTAVLNVQKTCISLCYGGAEVSLDKLHSIAENQFVEQLKGIGFDLSDKGIEKLFPHHLSHYLGLDVHDCIGYSRKTVLREGHCITIEPGIYVPDDERWPKHFRGMGIRIEDSIAVHEDECTVLTREAAKEITQIEALRS